MTRLSRRLLVLFSLLVLILQCGFSTYLAATVSGSPDLSSHQLVAQNFWKHLTLAADDLWRYGNVRGHAYHLFSPLPYLPYQLAVLFADITTQRGMSDARQIAAVAFTILNFIASLIICGQLLKKPNNNELPITVILFAATLTSFPQLGVLCSFINSDNFTITVCFYITAYSFYLYHHPKLSFETAIIVGLLGTLLLHAKANSFPFLLLLLSVFFRTVYKSPINHRISLAGVATALIILGGASFHYAMWKHTGQDHILTGSTHLAFMSNSFKGRGEFNYDPNSAPNYLAPGKQYPPLVRLKRAWDRTKKSARYTALSFLGNISKVSAISKTGATLVIFLLTVSSLGWIYLFRSKTIPSSLKDSLRFLLCSFALLYIFTALPLAIMPVVVQGRLLLPLLSLIGPAVMLGTAGCFLPLRLRQDSALVLSCIIWITTFWFIRAELLRLI